MITFDDGLHINLPDLESTQALASALAQGLVPGLSIYLQGNLGAGKTTLVRAMLLALGYSGTIKSPTYTLVESYLINGLNIYHFDLYRLADPSELDFIGIRDYVSDTAICIFEWPEKGSGNIPEADLEISLDFQGSGRQATLIAKTDKGRALCQLNY